MLINKNIIIIIIIVIIIVCVFVCVCVCVCVCMSVCVIIFREKESYKICQVWDLGHSLLAVWSNTESVTRMFNVQEYLLTAC